jgi:hypothetical protein
MANFKLIDTPLFVDLKEGRYNIWITGGRSVSLPKSFQIKIVGTTNKMNASVHEHKLKVRDFNGVNFFRVDIPASDKYEISIENYQDIVVKKTMLPITKLLFPKVAIEKIGLQFQKK